MIIHLKVYKRVPALTKWVQQMALNVVVNMFSDIWNKYRGCNERNSLGYSSVIRNLILDLFFLIREKAASRM